MVMHSAPRCSKVTMAFWRFRFTVVAFVTFWRSFAGIAQLVEQLICNQQVVGSNPTAGSSQFLISDFGLRTELRRGGLAYSQGHAHHAESEVAWPAKCRSSRISARRRRNSPLLRSRGRASALVMSRSIRPGR